MNQAQPSSGSSQVLTIGQFAFSGLALVVLWSLGAVFTAAGLAARLNQAALSGDAGSSLTAAAIFDLLGLLFLPSIYFSLLCLLKKQPPAWLASEARGPSADALMWALLPLWALVLLLGNRAATSQGTGALVLPILDILAVSLPILFLLLLGGRGLSAGSPQRTWGIFNVGMVAGPLVSLVAELLVFVALFIVIGIVVTRDPATRETFSRLSQRLMNSQADPETIMRILRPYLSNPAVVFSGLALIGGVFPLIEELAKPLGLWLLVDPPWRGVGRGLTPAQGFVGGMLSGAGFALMESLGTATSQSGSDWAVVALARGGTDLLHILCSGLVGWGLVSAWNQRRFLLLGASYLCAVAIHGLWNSLSLLMGFIPLVNQPLSELPQGFGQNGAMTLVALGGLAVVLLAILITFNRRLRAPASIPGSQPALMGDSPNHPLP
ncbi:MAG TPA: PrsW family glutamic-type intramembrane protease [Anaerolineaceae bacterium]|nr:PrsW family glutamic-type intramembrane protease [Anaerolineaceae bacterium]